MSFYNASPVGPYNGNGYTSYSSLKELTDAPDDRMYGNVVRRSSVDVVGLDGLDVRRVCFEKSPHVAHARFYPEQYWTAVREVWTDACARVD